MKPLLRWLAAIGLTSLALSAQAHTGHGTDSLFTGLAHPLAADHLLAMLAVGLWSAAALPAGRRAAGPLLFMALLLAAALAGATGLALPPAELAIAATVLLFVPLLAAPRAVPPAAGLGVVALAAVLHGLAHGAEWPPQLAFAGYAAGFLLASALLHGAGLALGLWLDRLHRLGWRLAAGGLGAAGLLLLARA